MKISINATVLGTTFGQYVWNFAFHLEFERSTLEAHNMYRRQHGTTPLSMNYRMSIEAEAYAKKIAELGTLDHSGTEDGENIASVCRKGELLMSGPEATDIW